MWIVEFRVEVAAEKSWDSCHDGIGTGNAEPAASGGNVRYRFGTVSGSGLMGTT